MIIGVLSGGDRFFSGQPGSSYGTTAFYQPLYLFWDLIVANNPYKYVGTLAGDAKWTDPTHWVINLDPNYTSLDANGNLANALPAVPGAGVTGVSPKFGQVCFNGDCVNVATGVHTINGVPAGGLVAASPGVVDVASVGEAGTASGDGSGAPSGTDIATGSVLTPDVVSVERVAAQDAFAQAVASPTAANGLPGATNFVPSDTDGNPVANVAPRYYDVTLAAAGTTTLDVPITIDRLTFSGSSATLNITAAGSLTSLSDTTANAGTLNVDGRYTSVGDIALIGGLLSGSGTVNAGHTTSVLGAVAPGGLGKIGTLTVQGDVVLSSGNRLYISVGGGNTSSLLLSEANAPQGVLGTVNLGGLLSVAPVAGYTVRYRDNFLVVSAQNGVTGVFDAVTAVSQGVLFPQVVYSPKAVNVLIQAASYRTVINANSQVQRNYAALLDGGRQSYSQLGDLYGPLDVLAPAALQPTLEALAPFHANQVRELATMAVDALSQLHRSRIEDNRTASDVLGALSVIGQPLRIAALDRRFQQGSDRFNTDGDGGGSPPPVRTIALPAGVNAYIAGGYLNGTGLKAPSLLSGKDAVGGYYVSGGGELSITRALTLGASLGYTRTSANTLGLSRTRQTIGQFALYGAYRFASGYFLGGEAALGAVNSRTTRMLPAGGSVFNLRGDANGRSFTSEWQFGHDLVPSQARNLTVTPIVGLRYQHFESGLLTETGGGAALWVENQNLDAIQGRLGLNLRGDFACRGITVIPRVSAAYVHDFSDAAAGVFAGLFSPPSAPLFFAGPNLSRDWGEIGGNVTVKAKSFDVTLAANTNLGRKDLDFQTYTTSVRIRF